MDSKHNTRSMDSMDSIHSIAIKYTYLLYNIYIYYKQVWLEYIHIDVTGYIFPIYPSVKRFNAGPLLLFQVEQGNFNHLFKSRVPSKNAFYIAEC